VKRAQLALRQEAGQDGGGEQNASDRNEDSEVERLYAEEKALHGAADEISADQAKSKPDGSEELAITNDETDHSVARSAKRHAECDLMRASMALHLRDDDSAPFCANPLGRRFFLPLGRFRRFG